MTTFAIESKKSSSEKITLVWVRSSQRANSWTLHSGSVYKKIISFYCELVAHEVLPLALGTSAALSAGQFYYDITLKTVYVRLSDSSNPDDKELILTYRHFFSNAPLSLPWDLLVGEDVEYEARLESVSDFKQELDDEQTGIIQESNSRISLENNDGFFDGIYDTHIFENKSVECFSWFLEVPLTDKRKVFKGIITSKTFSSGSVSFGLKDFIYNLRNKLNLGLFSDADGTLNKSVINTPKRRIYGRADSLQCVAISIMGEGYALTGAISGAQGDTAITGSGTSFLSDLSPGDEIFYTNETGVTVRLKVSSILSDTSFSVGEALKDILASQQVKVKPSRPWRVKNRRWHIAGHKLRSPSATITSVINANRFLISSSGDFFDGDNVVINGEAAIIKRVTGNNVVLYQNLDVLPIITDIITKEPVKKAYIGNAEMFISRDFTISNLTANAIVELNPLAEFNVTSAVPFPFNCTFTGSSRSITTVAADVNFQTDFKTRDWISSSDITHTTFYEILEVKEKEILIRTAYAGSTVTVNANKKNVLLVDDSSLILVDTMGIEVSGEWKSNAARAVKHLCSFDAEISNFNNSTFTEAEADAYYHLSLVVPEKIGEKDSPIIRDVITKINESVFGSLYLDQSFDVSYQVLSPKKPASIQVINDDDIVDFSVESKSEIFNSVAAEYSPFADKENGEESFQLYSFTSDFVDRLVGIKNEYKIRLFLYALADATIIAQRYALIKSLSSSVVKIKSNTFFSTNNLNDFVQIEFDRIYKRFSNQDRRKICKINSIARGVFQTKIELGDLGNMFNRVMSITANADSTFTLSADSEKIKNGYIVANVSGLPDATAERYAYSNIIG